MPIQTRKVKPAAHAAQKWGTGVSNGGAAWADGYANPKRNPFDAANINDDGWHQGVTKPEAKERYKRNMNTVDQNVVLATVKGAGLAKYQASGTTKTAKYKHFAETFMPKLETIVAHLDNAHPRRPRGQNRARLNAFLDAVEATRGQNHA